MRLTAQERTKRMKETEVGIEVVETEDTAQDEINAGDPKALLEKVAKGTLTLVNPIRAGGKDVAELEYDFQKLTGWEYAEAMDEERGTRGMFQVSAKQCFALFAAAAAKATKGIDATDIKERMGAADAVTAGQVAQLFYIAAIRAGNKSTWSG